MTEPARSFFDLVSICPLLTPQVIAPMTSPGEKGASLEVTVFLQPSPARLAALCALYAVHCLVTLAAFTEFSLLGIFQQAFVNLGTGQIFSDLAFALTLVCTWLVADARARGAAAWPWVLATLLFGSLAPGLYLVLRERALLRAGSPAPAVVV